MSKKLESILGANWRTTLAGIGTAIMGVLTGLAALPYELGDVATIISPEAKPWLVKVSGISTVILFLIKSALTKDRAVTGNGSIDDPNRVENSVGGSRYIPLLLCGFILGGCTISYESGPNGK